MLNNFEDEYIEYPVVLLNLTIENMVIYLVGIYKKEDGSVGNFEIKLDQEADKIKITSEKQAKIVFRKRNYKFGSPMKEPIGVFIPENFMFK